MEKNEKFNILCELKEEALKDMANYATLLDGNVKIGFKVNQYYCQFGLESVEKCIKEHYVEDGYNTDNLDLFITVYVASKPWGKPIRYSYFTHGKMLKIGDWLK
ncbi:MAG: hypothetical protein II453_00955 [Alphaproteobacteria bacterium]|nr:hypothetical protein [Alphaproteobacteria bacterium]